METITEPVQGELTTASHNGHALAEQRQAPLPSQSGGLFALIARAASDPSVDIDKFERLLAMQEKQEQAQEKREFNAALARAKAQFGPILKRRTVDFSTAKGRTHYKHEDLAEIASVVDGPLGAEGVSYRFRSSQEGKGGDSDPRRLRVTCIVSRGGYSEETSLEGFEDHSGNKNTHQAVSSAATYLQRATLKLALGLAAGVDDDAQAATARPTGIPEAQAAEIIKLIEETDSETTGILKYVGASSIEGMTTAQYVKAKAGLERKAKIANKGEAA